MKDVLIIEDDKNIVDLLEIHLTDLDCSLHKSYDGLKGLNTAISERFDLIILDLMLPRMDGLEICRQIRARNINTPVLMLTAKSEEIDKVLGLEIGADDYLTKPFSIREFIARVKAIFRRVQMQDKPEPNGEKTKNLSYKGLELDVENRKVLLDEKRVELTPKEFDLLLLMASHPGRSYSREKLLNLVWGYEFSGYEHTVNAHINRLRSKIEQNLSEPKFILTTWGVGYR
ncbi:MAG: response regulator transcription factor, partial [Flammeovirgaceae bacterium]|nr:response regulator transcription factor [Flammeovirgaceae bacterium]